MFRVDSVTPYEHRPDGVVIAGKATSVSDVFTYTNGWFSHFYGGIPEVDGDKTEVIFFRNHPGGDQKFRVVIFPAEGFIQEDVIREAPLYQPQDADGNFDIKELPKDTSLNIWEDGKGGVGRSRREMYNQGV